MTIKKTQKAPCEVCRTRKLSRKSSLYALKSGDTHLRQYLPATSTLRENPHGKERIILEGLKPNLTLFYFATNSRDFTLKTKRFADAYDVLQNSGVVKTDSKGTVEVKVGCPQVYIAEDGEVYSRHFHILYWNNKGKGTWENKIYTHQIFCNVDRNFVKKMMKNPKVVIVDALTEDYYNQKHIKGAVNIPAHAHKWTLKEVLERLPKGTTSTTPIILYCYSPECNAAEKLWEQLNRLGFYNTMHYVGGISNWNGPIESTV